MGSWFISFGCQMKFKKMLSLKSLIILGFVIAVIPLFLIFFYTLAQGINALNIDFFIHMPKPVGETGGGMANALMGTAILIGLGCLFGLPISIFAGIYLAEYGNNAIGQTVRFFTDVLSGVPSIVVGVVAYILVVIPMKQFSALAGGVALAILMIPTATRTTEEMIKLVPQSYREAALANERNNDWSASCNRSCGRRDRSIIIHCIGQPILVDRYWTPDGIIDRLYLRLCESAV